MIRPVLRLVLSGFLLALIAAPGASSPGDPSGVVPLDLAAGRPRLQATPDGSHVIPRIEGFGLTSPPGVRLLPLRGLLVAIPEGSVPELQVLSVSSETIDGVDVAPVPRLRVRDRLKERDKGSYRNEFAADESIFGRAAEFPAAPVRLGAIGYLREQRYVEVLFTPVLYNPGKGQARYFPRIRAQVRFTLPGGQALEARGFRPDPLFEETYRQSLVNYEQGKRYRVRAGEAAPPAAGTPTPAGSPPADPAATSAAATIVPAASGTPRYKVLVSKEGVYRLDYAYLSANAPDLLAFDPRTLMITVEGV